VVVGEDLAAGASAAVVFSTTSGTAPVAGSVLWTQGSAIPADTSFFSIASSPGGNDYYVGGSSGMIFRSSPATFPVWTSIGVVPNGPTGNIVSLQAPGGAVTLVAADGDGTVHIRDTAPSWTVAGALVGNAVSVGFENPAVGYAATQGAGGGIFKTVNGGSTWTRQVTHTKNTMRFVGSSSAFLRGAWACGENGTILITNTAGN
jgi:photosystem II stability/assembly factor-like uncharacterized protein